MLNEFPVIEWGPSVVVAIWLVSSNSRRVVSDFVLVKYYCFFTRTILCFFFLICTIHEFCSFSLHRNTSEKYLSANNFFRLDYPERDK